MQQCKECNDWYPDIEIQGKDDLCPKCNKKANDEHAKAANEIKEVWAQKNKVKILK